MSKKNEQIFICITSVDAEITSHIFPCKGKVKFLTMEETTSTGDLYRYLFFGFYILHKEINYFQ